MQKFHHWLSAKKAIWKEQQQRNRRNATQTCSVIDFGTAGVRKVNSGKWAVEISFRSKLRYIGAFKTQAHAALANKVARKYLKQVCTELTAEENDEKAKLARDFACKAVAECDEHSKKVAVKPTMEVNDITTVQAKIDINHNQSNNAMIESKPTLTSPTSDELNIYLQKWLEQPGHGLMPSLTQKEVIMKETGVTQKRLESWFYRARKRLKGDEKETLMLELQSKRVEGKNGVRQRDNGKWVS